MIAIVEFTDDEPPSPPGPVVLVEFEEVAEELEEGKVEETLLELTAAVVLEFVVVVELELESVYVLYQI